MSSKKRSKTNGLLGDIRKNLTYLYKISPSIIPISILQMLLYKAEPFIGMILGAEIVDQLVTGAAKEEVLRTVLIMVGTQFVVWLIVLCLEWQANVRFQMIANCKNRDIGYKAMNLDYDILERNETQELIAKANGNAEIMGGLGGYLQQVVSLIGCAISCIAAIITMVGLLKVYSGTGGGFWYSFFGSPVSYAVLLVLILVNVYINSKCVAEGDRIRYSANQMQIRIGRVYWFFFNLVTDYPMGKDIRIFKMHDLIIKKGSKARDEIEEVQKNTIRAGIKLKMIAVISQNLFIFAAYLFVGIKAIYGMISIGEVTKYIGAITLMQAEISTLFAGLISIRTHNTYLESYTGLMELPNEKYDGTLPVEKRLDKEYELEFKNVSFHYPNSDRLILKNVSFRLVSGEKLAIVGANGAGKTTFIKLLCRLYDPTEGEILLNGINIQKYDYKEYIDLFSVVFQDYKIFSFSVAENVAAGPEYEEERVIQSLTDAGIYDRVLEMKSGIDTKLLKDQQDGDEEGVEISGGEKQKIALARALYRDAPVVILDEPTSALDPLAEQDIYQRFNEMVRTKTAVFISHRMSSCKFCDRIVVFDDGRIVETGTHDKLVSDVNGVYHRMWEAQAQWYK